MPVEGVHVVPKRLAGGAVRYYYYPWRGAKHSFWQTDGFRYDLAARKLPQDFIDALYEARQPSSKAGKLGGLIDDYLTSPESPFQSLSPATKKDRRRYLDRVRDMKLKGEKRAEDAPLSAFERAGMRRYIRKWRGAMKDTPKAADEAKIALSAVLQYGVAQGDLTFNVCHGIESLYEREDDARTWTEDEQALYLSDAGELDRLRFLFIRYTGLRRKDGVEIETTADHGEHLIWRSSKSRRRHEMLIPVLPQLRPVMAALAVRRESFKTPPPTIIFGARGKPLTPDGFSAMFNRQREAHGIEPTMHDLRKNAATDWIIYQNERPDLITDDMICDHFDWTRATLKRMKRIYVNRSAVIDAISGRTERKRNV